MQLLHYSLPNFMYLIDASSHFHFHASTCRSFWQIALDTPTSSLVSKTALSQFAIGVNGPFLMTKEHDWPTLLMTLQGHEKTVNAVAIYGGTVVSGSDDKTLRWVVRGVDPL